MVGAIAHQVWISPSAETTRAFGETLGGLLQPGDFVGLVGDLGAGKTEFARGVAEGAGVALGQVASPTFAIVYPYQGRIVLYHADFYRLNSWDDLYATGFMDMTQEPAAILVEWLDRFPNAAPSDHLLLRFETGSNGSRRLDAQAFGPRSLALVNEWQNLHVFTAPAGQGSKDAR